MKLKNRTLKEQIWFYMAIFSTALIALLWILQVLFFDTYYEQRTTKDLETLAYKTKYYYVMVNHQVTMILFHIITMLVLK